MIRHAEENSPSTELEWLQHESLCFQKSSIISKNPCFHLKIFKYLLIGWNAFLIPSDSRNGKGLFPFWIFSKNNAGLSIWIRSIEYSGGKNDFENGSVANGDRKLSRTKVCMEWLSSSITHGPLSPFILMNGTIIGFVQLLICKEQKIYKYPILSLLLVIYLK